MGGVKVKNRYWIVITITLAIFGPHIKSMFGFSRLLIVEPWMLLFVLPVFLYKVIFKDKLHLIELLIFLFLLVVVFTGLFKVKPVQLALGTFFLFKPFLSLLFGRVFSISKSDFVSICKYIGILGILSWVISVFQFFGVEINPFDFPKQSTGIIGIVDNTNKNAQLMVISYLLYKSFWKGNPYVLTGLTFVGVLLTGSRQGLLIFLGLIFFDEIIIKGRYRVFMKFLGGISVALMIFGAEILNRFSALSDRIASGEYFRLKAMITSFQILFENPLFGSGAGTFGGIVAYLYSSKYQIELWKHWENYKDVPKTIDVFFPHLWAEVGLIGFGIYMLVFILLFKETYRRYKEGMSNLFMPLLALFGFSTMSMAMEAPFLPVIILVLLGSNDFNNNSGKIVFRLKRQISS